MGPECKDEERIDPLGEWGWENNKAFPGTFEVGLHKRGGVGGNSTLEKEF